MSKNNNKRRRIPAGLIILALLIVVIASAASKLLKRVNYYKEFNEAFKPGSDAQIEFVVSRGETYSSIGERLMVEGLIDDSEVFINKTKLLGLGPTYQAGTFLLSPSMTMEQIMAQLQDARRETVRITIPEGYTIKQVGEKLEKEGIVKASDLYAALESFNTKYWFFDGLEAAYPDPTNTVSAEANKYEGFLFPETYEIYKGSSAKTIITKLFEQFGQVFTKQMRDDMIARGLTVKDVVTMASLIERECRDDAERPVIASVIYNRIDKGMNLELDCAIQYILGSPKEGLTLDDLEIDSPYNIYKNSGLTPGPIASPGLASIKAVIYPEDTDYLFYVLKSKSSVNHNFAVTYDEFLKYKKEYKNSK